MKDLHQLQLQILRKLLYSEKLNYGRLKPYGIENSQFQFHLDSLLTKKFIEKIEDGYQLSEAGKEFANRMDTTAVEMRMQSKVTTILCCTRNSTEGPEYLIYKRLKNPFFGHIGFPTHKFWFGDKAYDAAKQGLEEECGLRGAPKLLAIRHYHVHYNNEIVEDKIMHIFKFENPTGELVNQRDGEYMWMSLDEIKKLIQPKLPEFDEVLNLLKKEKRFSYLEVDQFVNNF